MSASSPHYLQLRKSRIDAIGIDVILAPKPTNSARSCCNSSPGARGCWQIAATTRTGSGHLPPNGAHGQTSRPSAIARTRSASAPYLYRDRNLVERFFNKIKQCRRVATRYDKLAANYRAFVKLACIRLWLRVYESTA